VEYRGDTFLDWTGPNGSGRWNIPSGTGPFTLNFSMTENRAVTMNVCQKKTGWPDDCSGWKSGVS